MSHAGLGHEPPVVKAHARPPCFLADVMLGSLTRWLRILGFDVEFGPDFDDDALIRRSNATGRVLLTADRALAARAVLRDPLLVPPSGLDAQLRAVARMVPLLPLSTPLTRCVHCNAILSRIPRDRARERVPPHIFDAHDEFLACGPCGRVFWHGTHRDRILRWIEDHLAHQGLD